MGVEEREPGHLGVTMSLSVLGNTWTVNFRPFVTAEFQHLIIFLYNEIDTQNRRDSTSPGWPEAVLLQKAAGVCMLHDVSSLSSHQCWTATAGARGGQLEPNRGQRDSFLIYTAGAVAVSTLVPCTVYFVIVSYCCPVNTEL